MFSNITTFSKARNAFISVHNKTVNMYLGIFVKYMTERSNEKDRTIKRTTSDGNDIARMNATTERGGELGSYLKAFGGPSVNDTREG